MSQLRVGFLSFCAKPSEIGIGTRTKSYGLNLILVPVSLFCGKPKLSLLYF